MEKIVLVSDTDNRCKYIDHNANWYYVDDWADKFFKDANGEELYQEEKGKRILCRCDKKD